ncbi:MAG: 2,3-bisphosphoglycerate-independent phosphoglycerate mutase [Clostridia bacterium]|nr:2,3-bisphosphoglycerate-independent phosphoglycerate mutase [Clostridia bacterium]
MQKGVLIVLDGYGEGKAGEFNAVENANTPTLKKLKTFSHSLLKTHGESVGLFESEMGGSEVGHTTIGAGRVVKSTAKKIRDEILSGDFQKNKTLNAILNNLKKNKADLHLFGLMSDKNIHSNILHCLEITTLAKDKAKNIYIHFVTDGRDSGVHDSLKYLKQLKNHIKSIENCQILSVSGRFYAMDRENHEERTNTAYFAMFKQNKPIEDVEEYIKAQHKKGNNDQYIEPVSVKSSTFKGVNKNDCVLFFNFREDRLRQIVKKCEELNCNLVTMADVGDVNAKSIYPSEITKNTLSEYLCQNGLSQIKISETTKYAHVTYFLNGGREEPFKNEERIHIPTKKTTDYAKTPTMRAKEITKQTNLAIKKGYDAIIVNYSNADMIGHTGNYDAVVKSLECLDKCVDKVLKTAEKHGYFVLVTADHGNSEEMKNKNGEPNTTHTINRVMCVVADGKYKMKKYGELSDVAPTFVELLGLEPSKYFEGKSLIM